VLVGHHRPPPAARIVVAPPSIVMTLPRSQFPISL
jgi:hypothetical protein